MVVNLEFFDFLYNIPKAEVLTEEETKDFQPFLINKWIHYSGQESVSEKLNEYVYCLNSHNYYLALKTFLYKKYIKWNYFKKQVEEENNFFIKDIAKYYRINEKRAVESLTILTSEEKLLLIKKFGYDKKQMKKLGIEEKEIEEKVINLNSWW